MTIAVSSPITGTAQTGLTAPTYTLVTDIAPSNNGKQWAVSALGGTQTGVVAHSVAAPFTISAFKPANTVVLGTPNPNTGIIGNVKKNTYKVITRKGVLPLAGQPYQTMIITTTIDVPAGSDLADSTSVRAALSAHLGALSQQSAGIGDTSVTAIL
jgi:hypothetical protein